MNTDERDQAIIKYGCCAKFEEHAEWLLNESFRNHRFFRLSAEERRVIQNILDRAVFEKGEIRRQIMDEGGEE